MLQETKKTHTEVKAPQISVPQLADYMAASEQKRRTIAQGCKYRSTARVVQHGEARAVITNHILSGAKGAAGLQGRADAIKAKLTDSDFEEDVNQHNADYIERFAAVIANMGLPVAELSQAKPLAPLILNGVKVTFRPQMMLCRLTKTNKVRSGALMLRYAKGKPLGADVAACQSAAIFGFMKTLDEGQMTEADKALCITLDAYMGECHEPPATRSTFSRR